MSGSILNWDHQIELFARYFISHARLPKNTKFTLLDVGCGTGTALRILKTRYPLAKLAGCDLEPEHIKISRELNGNFGDFFVSDIESINSDYDIIYLSNVLEHLEDWKIKLAHLLQHTNRLYLLVPNKEIIISRTSEDYNNSFHINRFESKSFDSLKVQGYSIKVRVITTPFAWGSSPFQNFLYGINVTGNHEAYRSELLACITKKAVSLPAPFIPYPFSWLIKYRTILLPYYIKKYFTN